MISKLDNHICRRSSGILSSHSNLRVCNSCMSNFMLATRGITFPKGSNISLTFTTQSHFVRWSGMTPDVAPNLRPQCFFSKLSAPIFKEIISLYGNHFRPPTVINWPSLLRSAGGSQWKKVKPFNVTPPPPPHFQSQFQIICGF